MKKNTLYILTYSQFAQMWLKFVISKSEHLKEAPGDVCL